MKKLTQDYLMQILTYDAESGLFYWNKETSKRLIKGSVAGTVDGGYVMIGIDRKKYRAHRLAWLYVYGEIPKEQVDHINCIKTDNRIENLRLASHGQNCANRKLQANNISGYKGVWFNKRSGKWCSQVGHNNKKIKLGFYDSPEEAYLAYVNKAIELHGEFFRF